ncbi:MAG: hypothetical protein Q4Q23_01455 [Methanobacteriaceae archaeon]|nr:hypothetical protein [Methanobacteriaceae archaeon]
MMNTLKDLTFNMKKSIDGEYDEPYYFQEFDEKREIDERLFTAINDDELDEIIVDQDPEDDIGDNEDKSSGEDPESITPDIEEIITPDHNGYFSLSLVKVRNINEFKTELETVTKTCTPAIIDVKYMGERRPGDFKQLKHVVKEYKKDGKGEIVLLGSAKSVLVITPPNVNLLRK